MHNHDKKSLYLNERALPDEILQTHLLTYKTQVKPDEYVIHLSETKEKCAPRFISAVDKSIA